jgi:hypothetical protein
MGAQVKSSVKAAQNPSFEPANASLLQRQCACGQHTIGGECEECREKGVLQRASNGPAPNTVPPIVHEVLRSPGEPLDPAARASMRPIFGKDFSHVRVHTNAKAAESARAINALAYTVGQDIVFGAGRYAPGSSHGMQLLAHELTHVFQQSGSHGIAHAQDAVVLRKKDKPKEKKKAEEDKGPKRLYEHRYRGRLITKYSVKGIDFLVGVFEQEISNIEANLNAIAAAIVAGNGRVSDEALKVKTCIIAPSTTRYATYKNKPVLVLAPSDANSETATHEIGHAIFDQYRRTSGQPKSTKDVGVIIADIYLRLSATTVVQDNERETSGNVKSADHPAGLWIADPSQWSKSLASEHPWDDADEFFASARKAYLLDQKGFRAAINKFTKLDSNVKGPAQELLAVLSQLVAGKVPKAPKVISGIAKAEEHIAGLSEASKVESSLGARIREISEQLEWTLDPSTIPREKPPGPSIEAPEPF